MRLPTGAQQPRHELAREAPGAPRPGVGLPAHLRRPTGDRPREPRGHGSAGTPRRRLRCRPDGRGRLPGRSVVYLDIENGGQLPAHQVEYIKAWIDAVNNSPNVWPGVYCSKKGSAAQVAGFAPDIPICLWPAPTAPCHPRGRNPADGRVRPEQRDGSRRHAHGLPGCHGLAVRDEPELPRRPALARPGQPAGAGRRRRRLRNRERPVLRAGAGSRRGDPALPAHYHHNHTKEAYA